jgi:hypothetical protein
VNNLPAFLFVVCPDAPDAATHTTMTSRKANGFMMALIEEGGQGGEGGLGTGGELGQSIWRENMKYSRQMGFHCMGYVDNRL